MTFSSLLSIRSHPVRVRGLKRFYLCAEYGPKTSHPVRVRGLKPDRLRIYNTNYRSHPVRVRGLKRSVPRFGCSVPQVAPRAGAWIETNNASIRSYRKSLSHPVRVRGLKQCINLLFCHRAVVAPRAGAWIETV